MRKKLLIMLVILALGITMGINFLNDRPLLSNPFSDGVGKKVKEEAGERAGKAFEKSKDVIKKALPD